MGYVFNFFEIAMNNICQRMLIPCSQDTFLICNQNPNT